MSRLTKIIFSILTLLFVLGIGIMSFEDVDPSTPANTKALDLSLTDGDYYIEDDVFEETMVTTVEPYLESLRQSGYFTVEDGTSLYYENYILDHAKANVVISHGFTETIDKYLEVIYYFLDQNYSVSILEHRGHGRSDRAVDDLSLIYVEDFNDYVNDLEYFVREIVKPIANEQPLFLYGHSMGGGISAAFLEQYPEYFDAAALTAPMLSIDLGSTPLWAANLLCNIATSFGFDDKYIPNHEPYSNDFDFETSSTVSKTRFDYINAKREANDYFKTNGASYAWLNACLDATNEILDKENCKKINIPVLVFQAENDSLVTPYGQNEFVNHVSTATLIPVPNSKHELYSSKKEIVVPLFNTIFDHFASQL